MQKELFSYTYVSIDLPISTWGISIRRGWNWKTIHASYWEGGHQYSNDESNRNFRLVVKIHKLFAKRFV